MKLFYLSVNMAILLFVAQSSQAIKITLFTDLDTYIERAHEIIIAECTDPVEVWAGHYEDMLHPSQVTILKTLKGERKPGATRISTIYTLRPGRTYLLYSLGGSAFDTDFLAVPELSAVPLPAHSVRESLLKDLEDRPLKEQVRMIFSWYRQEVESELQQLQKEKEALDKALAPVEGAEEDFILYVSNQSMTLPMVDITVFIDGKVVVNEEFDVSGRGRTQHNWKQFPLKLPLGRHRLHVESKKGEASYNQEFETTGKRWAVIDYWFSTDNVGLTPKSFSFHVDDKPILFE